MQNKPLQIKSVHASCGVTMCTNKQAHQIARTSGPGNNAVVICDECLLEACKLRFGEVLTGEDAATLIINADNCMQSVTRYRTLCKAQEEKIKAQEELIKVLEDKVNALQDFNNTLQERITLRDKQNPVTDGTPVPEVRTVRDTAKKGNAKK